MNAKKEEKLDKFYKDDVKALNGCYDYTLKEISAIIPRYESRKRAYAGLTKYLKKYKGIDLIIKSQKG